jgi:hypothetical protein
VMTRPLTVARSWSMGMAVAEGENDTKRSPWKVRSEG